MDYCTTSDLIRAAMALDSSQVEVLLDTPKLIMLKSLVTDLITVWNWKPEFQMFCIEPMVKG